MDSCRRAKKGVFGVEMCCLTCECKITRVKDTLLHFLSLWDGDVHVVRCMSLGYNLNSLEEQERSETCSSLSKATNGSHSILQSPASSFTKKSIVVVILEPTSFMQKG